MRPGQHYELIDTHQDGAEIKAEMERLAVESGFTVEGVSDRWIVMGRLVYDHEPDSDAYPERDQ